MGSTTNVTESGASATSHGGPPAHRRSPGAVTYVVLAVWAGVVTAAIAGGAFAADGAYRLALPAAAIMPVAGTVTAYAVSPRFRDYILSLDLRLLLAAQLWRVIGITFLFALAFGQLPAGFAVPAGVGDIATGIAAAGVVIALGNATLTRRRLYAFTALGVADFLVAFATGLSFAAPTLDTWPLVIFPTIMIPFFSVLHLIVVLQSRHGWEARVRGYTH